MNRFNANLELIREAMQGEYGGVGRYAGRRLCEGKMKTHAL
jgi:hypothetical protein